ncbi:hypothetical protein NP493_179g03007 [Ridgeia piscesae]|uniref:WAPL domain-containing protein n=1 Tax=Ridgeia piscesae TaxID=27915 RepID=A0AAD9P313_RIDPI|nr:hypothetical protein NP493_179g03007 [Ridgeia piscesae]
MLLKEAPVLRRTITSPDSDDAAPVCSYGSAKAKVQVNRQHKQLFTVVHNVKQAHECQEHGETQEFEDDIEYIMDGLDDAQPLSVRCLSTVSLATKCTVASFRMHLRAHSTLSKIFTALHDASQHATLALCTAAVMFMLSRDRLNMDLEKSSLELMLSLMSVDEKKHNSATSGSSKDYKSMKEKINRIFESVRNSNVKGAKNWQIDNITPGHLAMETLLSLTSKQAGDWFKEDLRTFGGLDHIIDTVCTCEDQLDDCVIEPTTVMLDSLQRIDRCLRVLENVTYLNTDNQKYLIEEKSCVLIRCLCRSLKVCENCLPFNEVGVNDESVDKHCVGYSLYSCMLAILRVLLNLTHENKVGCSKVGQHGGFIKMMLTCILRIPSFIPSSERFDLLVLGLGLLINLTEHCEDNRRLLVATKTVICFDSSRPLTGSVSVEALEALTQLFVQHHDAARRVEEEHDQEMDRRNKVHSKTAGGSTGVDGATDNSMNEEAEQSGVWQESEAGLEWVVIPQADKPDDDSKEDNGDDEDDDLRIQTSSQDDDENVTKALHRMGKHMEDCIVAAYTGLLVGTVIQTDSDLADRVVGWLPQAQFEPMIRMLKKFLGFMNFTVRQGASLCHGKGRGTWSGCGSWEDVVVQSHCHLSPVEVASNQA